MKLSKIIVSIFVIFLFIFLLNFVFSSPNILSRLSISKSHREYTDQSIYLKDSFMGDDVLYPPDEYLRRDNQNLITYKKNLARKAEPSRTTTVPNLWGTCPKTGTIRIPVFLVKFTDKPNTLSFSDLNTAFNSSNYLNGQGISVSRYWYAQSYGQLNIIYDVYDWYTAPNTFAYYSYNLSRQFQLFLDTVNYYNPTINFTQYDNDNDGRIDGFVLIYSDSAGTTPTGIFPHARILKAYNSNPLDGKYLGNVAYVPELGAALETDFEIGVTVHEFAHVLGLPDLYYNTPSGSGDGPIFDLTMMNFQVSDCVNKPINLDAWSKYYLGWTNPIVLTTDSDKQISLRSANDYPDAVILKNNNLTSREYFIIENRYRSNDVNNLDRCMFNYGLLSYGGFAIYHVDENKIEAHFMNNWVQWDPDGNWWDDTVSHPGVFYEQNSPFDMEDYYTDILDLYWQGSVTHPQGGTPYVFTYFNENQYLGGPPSYLMPIDMTTRSYSGILNPKIRFEALSTANQFTMTAKMLVGDETNTPTSSPIPGTYSDSVQVTLSSTTPAANIYYTLDGSTPTLSSTQYTSPITVPSGTTMTIKAIAKRNNYYVSGVMTSVYSTTGPVATPIASQPSGVVDYQSTVSLSTTTSGATIRYTLDGSDPTELSTLYISPITIISNTTLKAKAFKDGYQPSAISTYNYEILSVTNPTSTLISGYYPYGTYLQLYNNTLGSTIYYTKDGSNPTNLSTLYDSPIMIDGDFILKAIAYKQGFAPSQVVVYHYTSSPPPQNLILSFIFQGVDSQTTIDNDNNTIIIYIPYNVSRINLIPIIVVEQGCLVNPESGVPQDFTIPVIYTVSSATGNRSYLVTVYNSPAVQPPVANPQGGNYSSSQVVELFTSTPHAIIKYTTNGTEPNINSLTYLIPITINSTTTLKAKSYLYNGPTVSTNTSRATVESKRLSNLIPAPVKWYSSATITELYTIARKNKFDNVTTISKVPSGTTTRSQK